MVYIYPLHFGIEARRDVAISESSSIPPRSLRLASLRFVRLRASTRSWSLSESWFLSKVLENEFKFIEPSSIEDELGSLVLE